MPVTVPENVQSVTSLETLYLYRSGGSAKTQPSENYSCRFSSSDPASTALRWKDLPDLKFQITP